jgi:hypothetical protein
MLFAAFSSEIKSVQLLFSASGIQQRHFQEVKKT